tara:strand:- start:403 stop:2049 length:1647 start_codon:yes stop_codon:yes gene_type:complete
MTKSISKPAPLPTSSENEKFNAVLMEVIWTRLISIVDEAAKAIVRTSFSTLSNEANDFACVLTDSRGFSVAQNSSSIPSFVGALPQTVRHFIDKFGTENMQAGDILVTNDPWLGTGHLSDICLIKPIFFGSQLIAFSATTSHVPDIGGRLRAIESRQVFEEGLQIPMMKLISAGQTDETLVTLIRQNVRTPDQTIGDIWAQIGANELMARGLLKMLSDYQLTHLDGFADELFERTERAMRSAIAELPDGTYEYEFQTDGGKEPYVFHIALTVSGERIITDFSGTSSTQPRAINCVYAYTYAMTAYALKCALAPDTPNNEGMFRPIVVTAPEDSLVNTSYPAAVVARSNTGHYVPILVFGALQKIIPDKIMAGVGSPLWVFTVTGIDDNGRTFANVLFYNGGMGATSSADGESCLSWPSNISSTPIEITERNGPLFCHFKRLKPNSGGIGRHRGGLGQEIMFECTTDRPLTAMFMTERTRFPALGLDGGQEGGVGAVEINGFPADVNKEHVLKNGDQVLLRTPGGGGYGDPKQRSKSFIQEDQWQGYSH